MKALIRGLSEPVEFAIVELVAFGLPLVSALVLLIAPATVLRGAPLFNDGRLLRTIAYEVVIAGLLGGGLALRGWTLKRLGLVPDSGRREISTAPLIGAVIFLGTYLVYLALWVTVANLWPQLTHSALAERAVPGHLAPIVVLAVCVVNPVFEEVFVCGYVIAALRERWGTTTAINVSAAIRVAYHLYQGAPGVLGITPFALIAAYWFARTGRLWPVIVAHALMDLVPLWAST